MGDLPLYSKVSREITTTNAAASWAHTRLPSYSKFRNLVQCYVFLFAKMNCHSWLLKEEGAHLAASKRLIRSSSDNSSPDIDLGDQLLTNIGSILYVGILVCCTVDTVVGTDAALLTSITIATAFESHFHPNEAADLAAAISRASFGDADPL